MKKITFLFVCFLAFFTSNAQSVSGYSFSESTEAYTLIAGTNSTAVGDDGVQNGIGLGFNFSFGGINYSTISISTNGWIRLGADIGDQSWVNNLANNAIYRPLIAPFWDDHNRNTGNIAYALTGTTPNQVFEIWWNGITISSGGATSDATSGTFKMRLYETTGQIDFVYGPELTAPGNIAASIGLNDTNSFLSVTPGTTATTSSTVADNAVSSTVSLIGKKYTFVPQPQCSGMPVPGATLSTLSTACSGVVFTLSLENSTNAFGIVYQWQSSTNGVDYTDIAGATSPTYITSETETTYYRAAVSCGVETGISTPTEVIAIPFGECYCIPTYTFGKTDGDLISNVVITGTTLSNDTGTAPVNPPYTFFSGQPNYTATLQSGFTYTINVTVGTYQDQNVAAWIDYNDDHIFTTNERIGYSDAQIGSNDTGVFQITLTCDSPGGIHRMRIRDAWNTDPASIDPCANLGYGETEDYDVNINSAASCQAPVGLNATNINSTSAQLSWNSGCSQVSWDLHLTLQGGGLPTGAPSNLNVTSPLIVTGLEPLTNYEFYVRANCGAIGESEWSGPFLFSTLPVAVANDDCETAIPLTAGATFEEHAIVATNVGATRTIGQPNPTCGIFGFGGDVWFSIVVPADGNVTVETQADPGSPVIDTALTVFTGTCGALTTVNCNDDIGPTAFSQLILTGLTPGDTIYARVWEYANDTFGTFQVSAWNSSLKTNSFDSAQFEFYPNPVKDFLTLSYSYDIDDIVVFNLIGQQVYSKQINGKQDNVDLTSLPEGAYLVKVNSQNQTKTIKIIKE